MGLLDEVRAEAARRNLSRHTAEAYVRGASVTGRTSVGPPECGHGRRHSTSAVFVRDANGNEVRADVERHRAVDGTFGRDAT